MQDVEIIKEAFEEFVSENCFFTLVPVQNVMMCTIIGYSEQAFTGICVDGTKTIKEAKEMAFKGLLEVFDGHGYPDALFASDLGRKCGRCAGEGCNVCDGVGFNFICH